MKKIILCADDYGQNEHISQAIIALLKNERLSAVSCMTAAPDWRIHAKSLESFTKQAAMGLHFNLTEGKPLSPILQQSHGFIPLSKLIVRSYLHWLDAAAIESELNTQLDEFENVMGRSPDFIDGHQHIHQLPVVRRVLLSVYTKRYSGTKCYIRSVYNPLAFSNLDIKQCILQLLGARAAKKEFLAKNIPHNQSFSGVYSFSGLSVYSKIFPRFLSQISDGGLIMCHPGLGTHSSSDKIAESRFQEYQYLSSQQFLLDCQAADVVLSV